MSQVRFPCSGCGVTLGMDSSLAGKLAGCPKCKARTVIPGEPAVAAAPLPPPPVAPPPKPAPPPPPARELAPIRFKCSVCREEITAPGSYSGRAFTCPECGKSNLVPDEDEVGTFAVEGLTKPTSGKRSAGKETEADAPVAAWWPDAKAIRVPSSWAGPLSTARGHAEHGRWKEALTVLHGLHEKGSDVERATALHGPIAHCLARWAAGEFERASIAGELSKPTRTVLKKARDMQKWAGSFSTEECPLCGKRLHHLVGTMEVRTIAGSAYLCCAAPTKTDDALVRRYERIARKLTLATGLDPGNTEVPDALSKFPWWYRTIDLGAGWWVRPVTDSSGNVSGAAAGGMFGLAGDSFGEVLGEILFG